jgi:hypothetical protein
MPRQNAAADVVVAAGSVADDDPDLLVFIELRDRIGAGARQWKSKRAKE